jgi:hypothetical protein
VALLFLEGFDKYGGPNSNATSVNTLLTAGEWTSAAGSANVLVAGLSATGYALTGGAGFILTKTLAASAARLIGGVRFSATLAGSAGIQFLDGATNQCGIQFNTTGTFTLRNGSYIAGTVLGTSAASVTANTTHYLEWDIAFGNAAAYQLWLDGVSILSGSGDTTGTANNTANGFSLNNPTVTWDDLYLFDATGTANNAALLTSPRIETQLPSSDAAVQFAFGAAMLGASLARSAASVATAANQLRLRSVVPAANCTLTAISFLAFAASATVNLRPVVYSSVSGVPGALLGSGSTTTGTTASSIKTMPLTGGVALNAGTQYFVGFMCDIAVTGGLAAYTAVADDFTAIATFASGAPGTAPAMANTASTVIAGNVTASGANWFSVAQNPVQGSLSYVADATVGHEDLYGYPTLLAVPLAIYAVAVKASVAKSDAGAKTLSLRLKSGGTDSAGSAGAMAPGTSYGWLTSLYSLDPATGTQWTAASLNAAQAGVRVES